MNIFKNILLGLLFLIISILFAEVFCRKALGWEPYKKFPYAEISSLIKLNNGKNYFIPDSLIGYKTQQGSFNIPLMSNNFSKVNHGIDGYRNFGKYEGDNALPQIHIYGCSIGYGQCVDDSMVVSVLLQKKLSNYFIKNLCIPSHGMLPAYLQLKKNVAIGKKPTAAIFITGGFHVERDNFTLSWRKNISRAGEHVTHLQSVKMDYKNDSLLVSKRPISYIGFYGIEYSAIINRLDDYTNHKCTNADLLIYSEIKLLSEITNFCKSENILPIICLLTNDKYAINLTKMFKSKHYIVVNLSQVFNDKSCTCLPLDNHPNGEAHKRFASIILNSINIKLN